MWFIIWFVIFYDVLNPWQSILFVGGIQTETITKSGEYVLLFGDSLNRNALRDYCELHGEQHGTQFQLVHHNNESMESQMGYVCENRYGDMIMYVHIFNSGLDGAETLDRKIRDDPEYRFTSIRSSPLRIRDSLRHFAQ